MKKIYTLAIVTAALASCDRWIEPVDTTLQPGHIYCSDGSVLHPVEYRGSGKTAVGVVFWTNGGRDTGTTVRAYAVSLHDLPAEFWAETNEHIPDVATDENDFSGAANTAAILIHRDKNQIATPAALAAVSYAPAGVTGWFLPSVAQMKAVFAAKERVYPSLETAGGDKFTGTWYWSSTEDGSGKNNPEYFALIYSLPEGTVNSSGKANAFSLRPIISIR